MDKILVSACLLGDKTRYDGGDNKFDYLDEIAKKYELIPFCPEMEAGLGTPRLPAEIVRNEVLNSEGKNLTKAYNEAAEKAYRICQYLGIKIAILKDGSPSCGSRTIHDGKFKGGKIEGLGVSARYLISKGIKVYCETDNLEFLVADKAKSERVSPIEKEENRYSAEAKVKEEVLKKNAEMRAKRRMRLGTKDSTFGKRRSFHHDRDFERKDAESRSYGSSRRSFSHSSYHSDRRDSFEGERRNFHKSSFKEGSRKSFDENSFRKDSGFKKPYGERKSFGKKKPYGEKKNFTEKKSYGGKKPYGERKNYGKKSFGEKKYSFKENFHKGSNFRRDKKQTSYSKKED